MAKKKIKTKKAEKKAQENRYFFGALITIGGLLIVGIAFAFLFGGSKSSSPTSSGGTTAVLNQMENEYGKKWRDLGFTRWTHDAKMTMLFVDSRTWYSLPEVDQKKRIESAGKDVEDLIAKNGGKKKDVYIMIHDEQNRMPATYTGGVGAQIQK